MPHDAISTRPQELTADAAAHRDARRPRTVEMTHEHADGINDELTELCEAHGNSGAINLTIRCYGSDTTMDVRRYVHHLEIEPHDRTRLCDRCAGTGNPGHPDHPYRCPDCNGQGGWNDEIEGIIKEIEIDSDQGIYIADVSWSIPTAEQRMMAELAGEFRPWVWIEITGEIE